MNTSNSNYRSNYNAGGTGKDEPNKEAQKWTTERVNALMEMLDQGLETKTNPFWDGKPEWRAGNILFEYTLDEYEEIKRCAQDVIYFANKYCFAMTDAGIASITLRDYQEDMLREMQDNRKCIVLSPRQVGKTIVTGIFLTWFLLFNSDKNLMILSNNGSTTEELVDKIKNILANLPFFLKPGIIVNNVMSMKFDNGCRLFGRNTTKTAAIGFAVHFLYCDEFAHIHQNFLDPFWRSVYPTLSSSNVSRCVITSTPNGMNKFYEIYTSALKGENEFKAVRIDWWQVPGRDEAWRLKEIANLGSEEDFNQEYGNQFLTSSKLLLDGKTLTNVKKMTVEYVFREISDLHDLDLEGGYEMLKWHPKFDLDNIRPTDRFVFAIDTAGGGGGDYTVINIFKVVPLPLALIESRTIFNDESDFFALLQVGMFRSNKTDLEIVQQVLETLLYRVFGADVVKIVLEMDFKGNLLFERMTNHKEFFEDIFVHTKHSEKSKRVEPGTKMSSNKSKLEYCMEFRRLIKSGRIIPTEKVTFDELMSFGMDKKESYSSQIGHDDITMSMVNMSVTFGSDQYLELVEDIYDALDEKFRKAIIKKLEGAAKDEKESGGGYDTEFLKGLME